MSDELKTNVTQVDGFDDGGATEGDFIRVIQGEKWSFTNDGTWVNADEEEISSDREVVVVDALRVLQKWIDQTPVRDATRFLAPGEQVDVELLNDQCPRTEWSDDLNGRARGPWQLQSVLYLIDPATMQKFTYPTSTVGGNICIGELKDAVRMMRKFRGPNVYPVVSLSSKHMKTKFGGRQRPHLVIKRWISFGPDGTAALPPVSPPSLQPPASAPPSQSSQQGPDRKAAADRHGETQDKSGVVPSGVHVVEEPTLHEELNDAIPESW